MHPVFKNDPIKLKEYIDKTIQLKTIDGAIHEGTVYTIDPVSESIVLVNKQEHTSLQIIFAHAVKSILKVEESDPICPFENETKNIADEELARKKLKDWLEKNLVPVEEHGDSLVLTDQITIFPPYNKDSCLSSNEIVLNKIQNLIESMPP